MSSTITAGLLRWAAWQRKPAPTSPPLPRTNQTAQATPAISTRPFIGVFAVLLGALISTLDTRITSFGLADLRGAVHAWVDEGAWITTALTVGQMLIGPVSAWLGFVFGPRRVLMISASVFSISNFLLPFSPNLQSVLAFQFISGLSSGTFIPLTIAFVAQNLPRWLIVYGVAAYAMNIELSLNIAASIEGWFSDHWSWRWIFWDTALLAPLMMLCIHLGMPRQPVHREMLRNADWTGILYAGVGFSLIYAGLDQGNRLDWLNSGLIVGLLSGGCLLIAAFVVHELRVERPWINLRLAVSGPTPLIFLLITAFRFAILSTVFIIPAYLTTIQHYRSMEVGDVLIWIALPQFLAGPIVATLLLFVDARIPLAFGFALVGWACFTAGQLTQDWVSSDFLPSQIVQAIGQSFALTSMVWYAVRNIDFRDALTFGAVLQTARLFGGQLGTAFIQTFVRMREQVYSNLLGLHVTAGSVLTDQRLQGYSQAVAGHSSGQTEAGARATVLLAQSVQKQAFVLSYIDGFMVIGYTVMVLLILAMFLRAPPPLPTAPAAQVAAK